MSTKNPLTDLHQELGQMRWAGADEGWDLAIEAVRKRITELQAAAPAAQPSQEFVCSTGACHYRRPLTDEQCEAEFMRWNLSGDTHAFQRLPPHKQGPLTFIDGMRAAERAHNIGPAAGATGAASSIPSGRCLAPAACVADAAGNCASCGISGA